MPIASYDLKFLTHPDISYRVYPDQPFAELLQAKLSVGSTAFLDKVCLPHGQPWDVSFLNGIRSARMTVIVLSEVLRHLPWYSLCAPRGAGCWVLTLNLFASSRLSVLTDHPP